MIFTPKALFIQFVQRVERLATAMGDALQIRGFKTGGTTNQVPVKNNSTDFNWSWKTITIAMVSGLQTAINNINAAIVSANALITGLTNTKADKLVVFNAARSGVSMTMLAGDLDKSTPLSHSALATFNVPTGVAGSNGSVFTYFNDGSFNIVIVPAGGVTLKYAFTLTVFPGQSFQLQKRGTDNYLVIG